MTTFDSTKSPLHVLLQEIVDGQLQLPDFQRGWVWDDAHIRSLLVSIGRSFPVGTVMLLEVGGEARFQIRPVEGIELGKDSDALAERLILDGQQRLTSLTQVLKLNAPVKTKDENKREIERHYYIDIEKALEAEGDLEDAIIGVDAERTIRENFGRDVVLDLSTPEKEFAAFCFPCNQILNSDKWEEGLNEFDSSRFQKYMAFRKLVLSAFREYQMPVIELKRTTSKEAVCLVFEKVNTGGVPLSVFELITATYAADGFNLRDDWFGSSVLKLEGRQARISKRLLLKGVEATEFLQGMTLLHMMERRAADIAAGKKGKEVTPVSAKKEHVLALPLEAYTKWSEALTEGYVEADRFLRDQGLHHFRFLPYRSQLIPLSALMVKIKERWREPRVKDKIARWYWCGVLGEQYGSTIETKVAQDLVELLAWISDDSAPEPSTIVASSFQASRLDTLRSRGSAAYRGIYVLLQREGASDFFWKQRMVDIDKDDIRIDIHHIFPKKWCADQGLNPKMYDSIVNKTALSYKANRKIGGKAPSEYLRQIQEDKQVQMDDEAMDKILTTHLIDPGLLRQDNFAEFYERRKATLLSMIERVMGKTAVHGTVSMETDEEDVESEGVEAES